MIPGSNTEETAPYQFTEMLTDFITRAPSSRIQVGIGGIFEGSSKREFVVSRVAIMSVSLSSIILDAVREFSESSDCGRPKQPKPESGLKEWMARVYNIYMPPELSAHQRRQRASLMHLCNSASYAVANRVAYAIFNGKKHKLRKYRILRKRIRDYCCQTS